MTATDTEPFETLLDYLKSNRGFDFTGYKRTTLERRIAKRMAEVGVGEFLDYIDFLEVHPDEFDGLFNTILINVTAFFRDESAWDHLREQIVPRLLDAREEDATLRVWSAGCASGEEPYTLAIVLAEALGAERFLKTVKIYATDADDEALDQARQGVYDAKQVETVPEELRERYFDKVDQRYAFRRDLRRNVIFGRNDVVQDAPISRIDLLLCRNTLMYFNAETQAKILGRFHFALNPGGFLFLGRAEMLIAHTDRFLPVDPRHRVFTKVATTSLRERLLTAAQAPAMPAAAAGVDGGFDIARAAFDAAPVAQLVVDRDRVLTDANAAARELLRLGPQDYGRTLSDLEASYRPVELRAHLDEVFGRRGVISLPPIEHVRPGGQARVLQVRLDPLPPDADDVLGVSVTYHDLTEERRVTDELERSRRELSTAYEELQSTVEELETTNEELQSTNEELETTNEELQSTNEELETMNEELHSSNEQLETTNDALRQRSSELDEVNAFMETILGAMGVAVIVVGVQQEVQVWNRRAEDLWGLRGEEVAGQHLLGLDIGLPVERLKQPTRQVLSGASEREELVLDAHDRRGHEFTCRITVLPIGVPSRDGAVGGAIVLAEREEPSAD